MEDKSTLNQSIDDVSKHYSSMFSLPSTRKVLIAVAAECIASGIVAFFVSSTYGLAGALGFSVLLIALTLAADLAVTQLLLKGDPIYTLRRTLALSVAGWAFWLFFLFIGATLSFPFGAIVWVKLCLVGYAVVITLRAVVFTATCSASAWRKFTAVLVNPLLCIVGFAVFWTGISAVNLPQTALIIVFFPIVASVAVYVFISSLKSMGKKTYGIDSFPLFRSFMLNWVASLNEPLEELFEKTGRDADIEVNFLKFDASQPKAAIIVPQVHPGPFKNVGSSPLPALMKHEFQKEFKCTASVPLGILGHELDLASQTQNQKIITQVISQAKAEATAGLASLAVRATEGVATATCQIFGDTAFLSFSLAPETTEDLPQELGRLVAQEAEKHGLKLTVITNAHNSITDVVKVEKYVGALQMAAARSLQQAVSQPSEWFMVGAATVYPKEFSMYDGLGQGGITATVVQVGKQKTAYVVIDGNNMISGLREKILSALTANGFSLSEVFTTDTHTVSALSSGRRVKRGYRPIGEVMNHDLLINYIVDVAKKAEADMETCKAKGVHLVVPKVRVIGEAYLQALSTLTHKSIQKAKQLAPLIFGLEGLVLILLLILL